MLCSGAIWRRGDWRQRRDGSCVAHGEDDRIELLAVHLEVFHNACKQACKNDDKRGAILFVENEAGKVEGH